VTLPRWLAEFNRRFINPRATNGGTWQVLVHVGRNSAKTYRTPIGAIEVDGGYLIFVNYGRRTDWLRNVLAAGKAVIEIDGGAIDVVNPRLVPISSGRKLLPADTKVPPGWVGVEECLLLDRI